MWVAQNESLQGPWRRVIVSEYNGLEDLWGFEGINHCPPFNGGNYGCVGGQSLTRLDLIMEYYDDNNANREVYMFYRDDGFAGPPMPNTGDDGTWSEEDSPIQIDHQIVIGNGEVLDIRPNVVVEFNENTGIVINEGGLLRISGTEDQPVIFDASGSSNNWTPLLVNSNHESNEISAVSMFGG